MNRLLLFMMKKLIAIVAVTTVAVLTMLVAGQSPVSAHAAGPVWKGKNSAEVSADHRTLWVCDREKGNYVEGWVWWPSGPLGFIDKNGAKKPCSKYRLPRGAHKLAVCENREGCTLYYPV